MKKLIVSICLGGFMMVICAGCGGAENKKPKIDKNVKAPDPKQKVKPITAPKPSKKAPKKTK